MHATETHQPDIEVVLDLDATHDTEDTPSVDGRHARSERSRQAMVDAVLSLLREGNLRPSSAQITQRAGVTQRTLFNQFGGMESLIAAVAVEQAHRVLALLPEAGTGTFDDRAARYCRDLAVLLEETMHVRWAVVSNPARDWPGPTAVKAIRELMRNRIADAFAPEMATLDDATREHLLDALELETDPVAWRLRRVQQGLTVDAAHAVVHDTIVALITHICRT